MKSTLAVETSSQVEASLACFWPESILREVLYGSLDNIPFIECRIDNHSLVEAVYTSKVIMDKKLSVDIAIMRQMVEMKEIKKITWIEKSLRLADCLTRGGGGHLLASFYKR